MSCIKELVKWRRNSTTMGILDLFKKNAPKDEFGQKIASDAKICVRDFGLRFAGLDYSVDSLAVVDKMLNDLSDFYPEFEEPRQQYLVSIIGAYIFEVTRRQYGGKYYWYEQGKQPVLVMGEPDFAISILAFDKVRGRIKNGKEDNIPYYFAGVVDKMKEAKAGDRITVV